MCSIKVETGFNFLPTKYDRNKVENKIRLMEEPCKYFSKTGIFYLFIFYTFGQYLQSWQVSECLDTNILIQKILFNLIETFRGF